ncbi:hypothetical protein PMAYCL1PPCAC_25664, partial [Pristionchus mayeri]
RKKKLLPQLEDRDERIRALTETLESPWLLLKKFEGELEETLVYELKKFKSNRIRQLEKDRKEDHEKIGELTCKLSQYEEEQRAPMQPIKLQNTVPQGSQSNAELLLTPM